MSVDRDTTHMQQALPRLTTIGLTVIHLPPRSHDLSPPGSHFFGVVKNSWRKLKRAAGAGLG